MCGIVGIIPKTNYGFSAKQQDIFQQLLFADQLRGKDATGVIAVYKDESFSIQKAAKTASEFLPIFDNGKVDKDLFQCGVAAIGHNRAKTIGDNKDENAHPFVEDNTFAMVHNGTLRNHKKSFTDTEVDSHALTIAFKEAMGKEDWKTAMEETLGKVQGAFACVWYDQKKHEVCMIRNVERPLSIVETTNNILFGSEMALLHWVALRNGESIKSSKSLDTSKLYQFDLKKSGGEYSETFLSIKSQPTTGFQNGTQSTPNTSVVVKATPEPKKQTTTGPKEMLSAGATSFAGDGRDPLTRNGYKRLRAKMFRKTIRFDVEDVITTGTLGTCMVFGESTNGAWDLCDFRHSIRTIVKYSEHGLRSSYELFDVEFEGVVQDMEYDKENAGVVIYVEQLKNVTEAKVVTH